MAYSEFVKAVRENNTRALEIHFSKIFRVLVTYLTITMRAGEDDAKDIAQQSLMVAIDNIRRGVIHSEERFGSYLIRICKNEYLRMVRKKYVSREAESEFFEKVSPAEQVEKLLDEEKLRIIRSCLDQLPESQRSYILYWFENPNIDCSTVADNFGISLNNAYIKKHRIIKVLSKCFAKKWKK